MDLINFDTSKSLEELEANDVVYGRRSVIVSRVNPLRKKPVSDFTVSELCSMIQQNSSLKYVVPLSLRHLHLNALIKGDRYEGDLLNAVLTVEKRFWDDGLKDFAPILEAIVEIALAVANSKPTEYARFLQNCMGAINIFKKNVGLV